MPNFLKRFAVKYLGVVDCGECVKRNYNRGKTDAETVNSITEIVVGMYARGFADGVEAAQLETKRVAEESYDIGYGVGVADTRNYIEAKKVKEQPRAASVTRCAKCIAKHPGRVDRDCVHYRPQSKRGRK